MNAIDSMLSGILFIHSEFVHWTNSLVANMDVLFKLSVIGCLFCLNHIYGTAK